MNNNQEKIDNRFLFKQNRKLRLQIRQLKQINSFHKEAIIKLSHPHIQTKEVIANLIDLFITGKKAKKEQKLMLELTELEGQILILQKIIEQRNNDQNQYYWILADDFAQLRTENERMSNQLQEFNEKIGEVDYISGLVTKYKLISQPKEEAILNLKERERLFYKINNQKQKIKKLKQQKDNLMKVNVQLKRQVLQHSKDIKNMTYLMSHPDYLLSLSQMSSCEAEDNQNDSHNNGNVPLSQCRMEEEEEVDIRVSANSVYLSHDSEKADDVNPGLNHFITWQKKVIKESSQLQNHSQSGSSSIQNCPEQFYSLFPDKVKHIKKQYDHLKVPYLRMNKVRSLMNQNLKKTSQNTIEHINPTQKIIRLEKDLEEIRRRQANYILKLKEIEDDYKKVLRINGQLENRCNILSTSNQRLQANYQNIYKDYQFTKLVTSRVEKACNEKMDLKDLMNDLNSTVNFDDKLTKTEFVLDKIFTQHSKSHKRSVSDQIQHKNIFEEKEKENKPLQPPPLLTM